jgi:endo-1,4-beta-xylanase
MIKKTIIFLFIIAIIFTGCKSNNTNNITAENKSISNTTGASLVPLHTKWPFKVGSAAPTNAFNPTNDQYSLLYHFNVLVAENDMKPEAILGSGDGAAYRWNNADMLVNYAAANNTKIRGHVLIWHSQTPAWFFNGSGKEGRATKDELYSRMENHIKSVFEKYGGHVEWWDVVNEAAGDSGGPRTANSSKYAAIMQDAGLSGMNRYEYVLKAFQWARQYADLNGGRNVKLYLNDYNIETTGAKQSEMSRLIDWLIANNAPIDGIGIQCHIRWDHPSVSSISNAIDLFSSKTRKDGIKLMTQVTELDISVFSSNETQFGGGLILLTLPANALENRLGRQAQKYRDLFDMFKQKYEEGKLDMVLVWGLADGHSWLNYYPARGRTDYPLIFNRDYEPKQAYWELVK